MILTFSVVGAACAGAAGALLGSQGIFKRKKTNVNAFPDRPQTEVKFLSVAEAFNSEKLLRELGRHNVVFLNFQRIASSPMYKSQFMSDLRQLSRQTGAVLKLVANDIVMVALSTVKITTGVLEVDTSASNPELGLETSLAE